MIRKLEKHEFIKAADLAFVVFTECGKPDYDKEGLEVFKSFVYDEKRMDELTIFGAFCRHTLIGILGIREKENHISLFFIHPRYHRKGIGRELFKAAETCHALQDLTVNSSTYAVPFYESLGFKKLAEARNEHGLVSVPMKRTMQNFKLRVWTDSDFASLARYLNNKKIWDNCRDRLPFPYTEKDARFFVGYAAAQTEQNEFCIEVNGEAAGNIGFIRGTDVERYSAEVGYWLAEPYWNKGIMTAALQEALNLYFRNTDIIRIYATVYETNTASMSVLEKTNFRKAGIHCKACFKNGRFVDVHYYELLKHENNKVFNCME